MFSHQCYGWNPLMSHLTFHGGDGSMGHHGILDLLTAPCGACCDAGPFFHWAACNRDGSHLGWIDLLWLFWFTVCWCLLMFVVWDVYGVYGYFFRKQGKNTCFTVSQLLVALLYVQLHTTCGNTVQKPTIPLTQKDDPDTNEWVTYKRFDPDLLRRY